MGAEQHNIRFPNILVPEPQVLRLPKRTNLITVATDLNGPQPQPITYDATTRQALSCLAIATPLLIADGFQPAPVGFVLWWFMDKIHDGPPSLIRRLRAFKSVGLLDSDRARDRGIMSKFIPAKLEAAAAAENPITLTLDQEDIDHYEKCKRLEVLPIGWTPPSLQLTFDMYRPV